jgi:hypothetical protein
MNEQMQTKRGAEDMGAPRRDAAMERVEDRPKQKLSTRDLAGGSAERAKDEAQKVRNRQETQSRDDKGSTPLFETEEAESLRSRWTTVQTQFVDEPRRSVEQADELVAATMKRLAEIFASERDELEHNWDRGDDVSTEDLRIALQRYRSFFDRLLSV